MNAEDLPRNSAAERSLIGACLTRNRIEGRAELVKANHFSDNMLGGIWHAMLELNARGDPLDIVTVGTALKGSNLIGDAETLALMTRLIGEAPSSVHYDKYAELVLTTNAKRKLALGLNNAARIAYGNGKHDPAAVIASAILEIERAGEGLHPIERETWTAAELADLKVDGDPFLLEGLLIDSGLNLLAGEYASGKTFMCLSLAIAVATGGSAWGRPVRGGRGRVVYFGADNSRSNLARRIRTLCEGLRIQAPHESLVFDLSPLDLGDPAGMATIRASINEHGATVVIVDVLGRYFGAALDENSAGDVGRMMAGFRNIANSTGATFVLVHHLRKLSGQLTKAKIADRVRGSGDFVGAVDSALVLSTKGQGPNLVRTATHVKCREAKESDPIKFSIVPGEEGGSILTFETGDPTAATETMAEIAANHMANALQRNPGVTFAKDDLRSELESIGLINLSPRSDDRAFSRLKDLSAVTVAKHGRFNVYSWNLQDV